jgi:nicotinate-nucleotide adenylyltransferase
MKKIGILGGTLDPIHNGHLMIAECARDQLSLDEVWFMPTGNPPHKSNQNISPNEVRKEMIELAIEDNNNFKFSDFEYKRDGIIYTSDTMKLLKNAYKDTDFYFIMGADSLMYFKDWHKPEEIVLYCNLVVAGRDNDDSELLREVAILEDKYNINIHVLKSPKICISSSDIRDYINNKFSIKYMVPDSVERYIKNKNLYVK